MGILLRFLGAILLIIAFFLNIKLQSSGNTFDALVIGVIGVVIVAGSVAHRLIVEKNQEYIIRLRTKIPLLLKMLALAIFCVLFASFLGLAALSLPLMYIGIITFILSGFFAVYIFLF